MNKSLNQQPDNEIVKIKLHFFYCSLIFIIIIIAIATYRWTSLPKFTEFLSNAATMTSLVLGLIAIFYSFIANDGLSKSLGSIGAVSEEIKSSKEQIVQQVFAGTENTKAVERSAVLIDTASSSISSSLTSLSATLALIKTHTEGLPTRLDQLETKVIDATRTVGQKPNQSFSNTQLVDPKIVKTFLQKSSLAANLLTYASVLAYENKKEIEISEFCNAIDSRLEGYCRGIFNCMDAIQLIKVPLASDSEAKRYIVAEIHHTLISDTKDYILGYLERQYKEKNPEIYKRWTMAMKNIETLYTLL